MRRLGGRLDSTISALMGAAEGGDEVAAGALFGALYSELHRSRLDWALWTRWPQHHTERCGLAPWWRSTGVTRPIRRFEERREGCAADVPEFAGAVPAG